MNFKILEYQNWLETNSKISTLYSQESLREITFHLLMGRNYRLFVEPDTKGQLFTSFYWLKQVQVNAQQQYGEDWVVPFFKDIHEMKRKPKEIKNLLTWILGTTTKGMVNLGYNKDELPMVLNETIETFDKLFTKIGDLGFKNEAWLMLMAGSATLTIRGSQKSKAGKKLERVFLKACLSLLGFIKGENFWMGIQRDQEVERESDAEVESKRGRIRIESGLIAPGNQEVIEDKITRVGRNGVIIFDKLGKKSKVHQHAERQGVKLIQVRNSNPLLDLYRHLNPLAKFNLTEPPETPDVLRTKVNELPSEIFEFNETYIAPLV